MFSWKPTTQRIKGASELKGSATINLRLPENMSLTPFDPFDSLNLLRNSTCAQTDREMFFKCQFVFWLLAATDDHAKNFSICIEAGGIVH